MNKILLRHCLLLLAAIGALATNVAAQVRVGLSEVEITPPIGGRTHGYSSAQPTDGIHDPVVASVIVMESADENLALVVCDLCTYNSPWLHDQMASIGVDQLLLMNTHTHAGPKLADDDFPTPEMPWRETVDQRILEGIKQAKERMFPASFAATHSDLQLGYNRLVHRGEYSVTFFENPQRVPYGSVDPWVGVIRVMDDQDRIRLVVVNYACHPVVLGPKNRKISADYPGVVRELVEQRVGDDCMCVFIQGAGGDINPLLMARGDDREHDFEVVQAMGELLAAEVQRALNQIAQTPGKSESLRTLSSQTQFRNRWDSQQSLTLGVTTLLINDDIAAITLPGEPFHRFQTDWRDMAGMKHCLFFGYCCNGPYEWPSYLPDLRSAARGGYGASDTTRAEVGAGERLVNDGLVQLFKLQDRLKSEPRRHTFDAEANEAVGPN